MSVRRPFKLKGRNGYYIDINRKRRALGTEDLAEAMRLWNEIRRRIAVENAKPSEQLTAGPEPLMLSEFITKYRAWAEQVRPKPSARSDRYALEWLQRVVGDISLAELTGEHLDRTMATMRQDGLMPTSVNNVAAHLKAIFTKAEVWGMVKESPFRRNKLLKVDKAPVERLHPEGFAKLLEGIQDPKAANLIRAALATGRRRGELVLLDWRDVDLAGGKYFVRKAKDSHSRWYPINTAFRAVLDAILKDVKGAPAGRVFGIEHPATASHKVKDALRAAGLGHLHLHSLRHSFGAAFIEAGGDVRTCMKLLGHRQISTTLIYTNLSDEHLAKEAERITLPKPKPEGGK